jgi:hypothetical protein
VYGFRGVDFVISGRTRITAQQHRDLANNVLGIKPSAAQVLHQFVLAAARKNGRGVFGVLECTGHMEHARRRFPGRVSTPMATSLHRPRWWFPSVPRPAPKCPQGPQGSRSLKEGPAKGGGLLKGAC